jgi:hypothetical protein
MSTCCAKQSLAPTEAAACPTWLAPPLVSPAPRSEIQYRNCIFGMPVVSACE